MNHSDQYFSQVYEQVKGKVKHSDIIKGISAVLSKEYRSKSLDLSPILLTDVVTTLKQEAMTTGGRKLDFELLKKLTMFQCCFYDAGGNVADDIRGKYLAVYANHVRLYQSLAQEVGVLSHQIEMPPLALNLALPLRETEKRLAKITEIIAGIYYKLVEEVIADNGAIGMMPIWTFHKDVIGNEVEWAKTLNSWMVSFYIYDSLYNQKMSKTQIIKSLKHNSLIFHNPKDIPNSTHKLDRYLQEAHRLICSTQKYTFPITL